MSVSRAYLGPKLVVEEPSSRVPSQEEGGGSVLLRVGSSIACKRQAHHSGPFFATTQPYYIYVSSLLGSSLLGAATWPSGLRRQLKALVRKGVGSNPAALGFRGVSPLTPPLVTTPLPSNPIVSKALTFNVVVEVLADGILASHSALSRPSLEFYSYSPQSVHPFLRRSAHLAGRSVDQNIDQQPACGRA